MRRHVEERRSCDQPRRTQAGVHIQNRTIGAPWGVATKDSDAIRISCMRPGRPQVWDELKSGAERRAKRLIVQAWRWRQCLEHAVI